MSVDSRARVRAYVRARVNEHAFTRSCARACTCMHVRHLSEVCLGELVLSVSLTCVREYLAGLVDFVVGILAQEAGPPVLGQALGGRAGICSALLIDLASDHALVDGVEV